MTAVSSASSKKVGKSPRVFFDRAPYVHPLIVKDLLIWMQDEREQIVAINLNESQNSDRYYGEIKVENEEGKYPSVSVQQNKTWFEYRLIGKTPAGIYALKTTLNEGGTGYFMKIIFVRFRSDIGLQYEKKSKIMQYTRKRILIEKLGSIILGDRYIGELKMRGSSLFIGNDTNKITQIITEDQWVKIEGSR